MGLSGMFAQRGVKRDTRQAHLDSLSPNPPVPRDRDSRGDEPAPPPRMREQQNIVEESGPEVAVIVPAIASEREGDAEVPTPGVAPPNQRAEKRPVEDDVNNRPSRRRRVTAPEVERPDPEVEDVTTDLPVPASPSLAPPAASPSNALVVAAGGTGRRSSRSSHREISASWLSSSFRMPTEYADLRRLSHEIEERAAPLRNIDFTDPKAAPVIDLVAIRRSANVRVYRGAKQMPIDEVANRGGALFAQVCFPRTRCLAVSHWWDIHDILMLFWQLHAYYLHMYNAAAASEARLLHVDDLRQQLKAEEAKSATLANELDVRTTEL